MCCLLGLGTLSLYARSLCGELEVDVQAASPVPWGRSCALGTLGVRPQCGGARDARGGVRSSAAQAATAAPADFSRSHLLTAVPLPQPLPPQQRRAAVCARSVACNRKPRAKDRIRAPAGSGHRTEPWGGTAATYSEGLEPKPKSHRDPRLRRKGVSGGRKEGALL